MWFSCGLMQSRQIAILNAAGQDNFFSSCVISWIESIGVSNLEVGVGGEPKAG